MKDNAYRNIFKATAVFGGVQVFGILITIIRSKFIAVFLGPAGIGINALLTSSIGVIGGLTNFGLATSAVKNIAVAHASGDEERVGKVVSVFKNWVWITGMLGFVIALVMAPWLSKLAFGNQEYTWSFVLISVTLLMTQISAGQGVILRGMRRIKYMAQSGMIGSAIGLVTSVPLYYFFKNAGIVPAIIVTAVTGLLLTWYFSRKVPVKKVAVSRTVLFDEGKDMLRMGFMLSLSGLITMGSAYVLRIFITRTGSIEDVGLYNAGFAMINSYVGLIFTALSADYYPRLAGVAHDDQKAAKEINQQAETGLLIMAPILCFFLVFVNWAVILLYSNKFSPINSMVHWLALGMFLKASSWAVAFLILARGDSKVFFWNELITDTYLLVFNLTGYYFWGLTGLGVSFLVAYLIYLVQVTVLTKRLYGFSFDRNFIRIFLVHAGLGLSCFLVSVCLNNPWAYIAGGLLVCASVGYSFYEIDKRLGIRELFGMLQAKLSGKGKVVAAVNLSEGEVKND